MFRSFVFDGREIISLEKMNLNKVDIQTGAHIQVLFFGGGVSMFWTD